MGSIRVRTLFMVLCLLVCASSARAGVPECGGIRLEEVSGCEIKGHVECDANCSKLGIYETACATRLQKVCRQDCTLLANPTCTDSCTVSCKQECDRGVSITCSHNCFKECVGSCEVSCPDGQDTQCKASCQATCDGECDVKCAPVVDAPCYTHCIECCGGSCTAQANMSCQTTCQEQEFKTCEHELQVDCQGSCSADGALFCDGKYVLSGSDVGPCVRALIARGIPPVDLRVSGKIDASTDGCQIQRGRATSGALVFAVGVVLSCVRRRRRART
jgi:hypothetical protein